MIQLKVFSIILTCLLSLALASCVMGNGESTGGATTPPNSNPGGEPGNPPSTNPVVPVPALRAIPVAASSSAPKVLDSYTDGINNYYLIDVGYIRNTYISDVVAPVHYNGITTMSLSKTTVTESSIAQAMRETITNSVTVSNTQSHKTGIDAAWKNKFPVAGEFSVQLKYEWTGSWTNTSTTTRSTETSVTDTKRYSDSLTIAYRIGDNGEPAGYYRYALYAISDVYFVISTSLDNQQITGWNTAAGVRTTSLLPHMDYSPDGNFDNSPAENDVTFAEDFFKSLPKPSGDFNFNIPITTAAQWDNALTAIRNGGNGSGGAPKGYSITINGNIVIPGSTGTATSFASVQNIVVTLKGNGRLSMSSNGSILRIGNTQRLIIDSASLTLQGHNDNNNALLHIEAGGALELKDGTITGNINVGTYISPGHAVTNGGGGVLVDNGIFTMSGGVISKNVAAAGGGVMVYNNGTFNMTGGTITGNLGPAGGGGVYVSGTLEKIGGTITGMGSDPDGGNGGSGGHAVYAIGRGFTKRKNTTAGPGDNLIFSTSTGSFSGNWDP